MPPSPELPNAVTDLSVIERGDNLVISFHTPVRTSDSLVIKQFSHVELRIGPAPTPFDFDKWAASATAYELTLPPPSDPDDPKPQPVSKTIPVAAWQDQRVVVAVRTAIKKDDHFSQWSNRAVVNVIAPLNPPALTANATAQGYRLTWPEQKTGLHYQVFRKGPRDTTPQQIGVAENPEYLDTTSEWDTPYAYTVVAQQGEAESLPSQPVAVNHADTFPPSVPASITALAGPDSIEISWSRSPEADLKGYYLYRSVDGQPFARTGDLISLPTYSDHAVEHGKKYQYAVTAVDQKGNESERSAVAEVTF